MAKIVFRSGAFAEIRTMPVVMGMLDNYADRKAAEGGEGYHAQAAERTGGRIRGRAAVVATGTGARTEATHHILARG